MEPGARALLHANQPSLRLPAALPPSSPLPPPLPSSRLRRSLLSSGPAASSSPLSRASFPPPPSRAEPGRPTEHPRTAPQSGAAGRHQPAADQAARGPRGRRGVEGRAEPEKPRRAGPSPHEPEPLRPGLHLRRPAGEVSPSQACTWGAPRARARSRPWSCSLQLTLLGTERAG